MNAIKRPRSHICFGLGLTCLLSGLVIFGGCSTAPPTKFEQGLFTIQTNYVPQVTVQEHVIPITKTNYLTVTVTNLQGVTQFYTNTVIVPAFQTNLVTTTNLQEAYTYAPGKGEEEIKASAGAVGSLFGMGPLFTAGAGLIFGAWRWVRGRKALMTAANMAQSVETVREFVKALPNGQVYDNELVNWMQKHQAEGGVLNDVLSLLQRNVNNPDAKIAAKQVQDTISALLALQKSEKSAKV